MQRSPDRYKKQNWAGREGDPGDPLLAKVALGGRLDLLAKLEGVMVGGAARVKNREKINRRFQSR